MGAISEGILLNDRNLEAIGASARVAVPAYDRSAVTPGVVHFGVGGFHRSHQAVYVDALMSMGKALDWGIVGVGTMPQDARMRDVLDAQDGLYTVLVKHPEGRRQPRIIGSLVRYLFAADNPGAVLAVMTAASTRIVSLTITEGGYLFRPSTGEFDATLPIVRADLRVGSTPTTPFAFIVEALRQRRDAGTPAFTVMSCDNIPGNGDVAKRMICAFARLKDADLASWIESSVFFPNSMVDRITPITSDKDIEALAREFGVADAWPVVCEPFMQWALEDSFEGGAAGRPEFEEVGVQLVTDVEPYELMKLRLLNGSHQALCYLGYLAGYRYAHEVCQDPLFVGFLLNYMDREATPTLHQVPGIDLSAYKHELIDRFANPEVQDTLARLCAESSDRIPKWLVPVIRDNLAGDGEIKRSVLVVAAWARYAEGVDESGQQIDVVDQLRDRLMAAAAKQRDDPLSFVADEQLFGDLSKHDRFVQAYRWSLDSLHTVGARSTLERLATSS
ncbi:MAG: mannitol dehydrogenase family protein [Mycobacteriales bacterium]